ncbi:MAG: hypothetical protein A2V21_311855 [Deltaproteobacteria bacterium GWC2_55_46]|nr:MAG: hypothetical protein A2Z79_11610 [Deltaproteobacteria bacterium GWA2_55_82]OIJ74897.1 MAG: hypothetical protein A2V21_311855 [Deltaproteobacteria bacterium GWC2_55_46]
MQKRPEEKKYPQGSAYLYCVTRGEGSLAAGIRGIEAGEIKRVRAGDLSAFVQEPSFMQGLPDKALLEEWIVIHHRTIEAVILGFGAALPFGFGKVLAGEDGKSPDEFLLGWLAANYEDLKEKLDRVEGRDEYGVQVFWDAQAVAQMVSSGPEIKKMVDEVAWCSEGTAYLQGERLKRAVQHAMAELAGSYFAEIYRGLGPYSDRIKVEQVKKAAEGRQMIVNVSCLVRRESADALGEYLGKVETERGAQVRFTGPWPPYSFV